MIAKLSVCELFINESKKRIQNYEESLLKSAIEIGENGVLRFVDSSEIKSDKGTNTSCDYNSYKVGGKECRL